jgi:integrase
MRFTDVTIRALPVGKYFDSTTPAFGIRVGKSRRTWIVMRGKKRQLISLGHYPAVSLSEARTKGKQLLASTQLDHERITVQQAYDLFVKTFLAGKKPRTQYDYKRVLKRHYLPTLANKRLEAVTSHMVLAITDELVGTPSELIHATAVSKTFFKWCIRRHYISTSPLQAAQLPRPKKRKRVLNDLELKRVWDAAVEFGGVYGALVKLIILTGLRRTECADLQPDWVQPDRITLPASITKNSKEFCFPIGSLTQAILESLKTNWHLLLPTIPCGPLPFNTFSKTKKEFDKLLPGMARYTLHDLRRSYRTNLARLRVHKDVAERLINHTSSRSELESPTHNVSGADHALASLRESNLTLAIMSHASALAIVASKSFARRRLRLSQAMVRSTTQRRGNNLKPLVASDRLTISIVQRPIETSAFLSFGPA